MIHKLKYGPLLLFLVCLLAGCNHQPSGSQIALSDHYFDTPFQTESQFIVEAIITDLVEMATIAKDNLFPADVVVTAGERIDSQFRSPNYEIEARLGSRVLLKKQLRINQPIWSPELYKDIAKTLLANSSKPANLHNPHDLDLMLTLTNLQPKTIEQENQRISGLLTANFKDPTLHEMAAIILGSFALRECSGYFYDVRSPLCRMAAHLALARAFSGGSNPGINGRLAEVMLLTLMDNQTMALNKLKELENEPQLKPWVNALRARNTYDYRELQKVSNPSLLERIMNYLALSRNNDADAGWTNIPPALLTQVSDFSRIALGGQHSVGLGHQLLAVSLRLELMELAAVHDSTSSEALSERELIEFLNQIPERCYTAEASQIRIIGTGQWAMFLQRHLCHTLERIFNFLQREWGVPEEAAKFYVESEQKFHKLRLYPFVRRHIATTKEQYHQAVDEGLPVTVSTPHLISPYIWNYLFNPLKSDNLYCPVPNPHINEWFSHNPPPGTAYNSEPRLYHPSLLNQPNLTVVLSQLHDLAPFNASLACMLIKTKYPTGANYDQAEEIYRPALDYSAYHLEMLAQYLTNDSSRYEDMMGRYAKMNPVGYFTLGCYFADRQEENKAAGYYEQGVELCPDSVTVSHYCNWLVKYYYRHGQRRKAEELADRAAEVYSFGGLHIKAELMEMEKNYDEALNYFLKIDERYDRMDPLMQFCLRHKSDPGGSRFEKLLQARLKILFPNGLEKIGLSDFKLPPTVGVFIAQENEFVRKAGLKRGNVIVALDNIRVDNFAQYEYVLKLDDTNEVNLIVWNGRQFLETKAQLPQRHFGVKFSDYRKSAK